MILAVGTRAAHMARSHQDFEVEVVGGPAEATIKAYCAQIQPAMHKPKQAWTPYVE